MTAPPHSKSTPFDRAAFRRYLSYALFVGLALRIGVALYADFHPAQFDFPDSHRYFAVARNLAAGQGPVESERVRAGTDPLYPLLLSIGPLTGFQCDASQFRLGRLLNSLASGVAIILLAHLGRVMFSPAIGLIAAWLLAIDPILVFFNALALTETVYLCVLVAAYDILARDTNRSRWIMFALAGLLLGVATLLRGSSLLLPLWIAPLAAIVMIRGEEFARGVRTRRIAAAVVMLVASMLPLLPTTLRNYRLFGEIVPVRTGSGLSLLEALGPWADGGPGMDKIKLPEFSPDADEVERDRICRQRALAWLRENPSRAAKLAFVKLRRTWSISLNAPDYAAPLYVWTARLSVAPVLLFALAGIVRLRSQSARLALLLAPAAYFTLLHMLFVGSVRYRLPAMPMIFLLAAVAIEPLWRCLRWPRSA